MTMDLRDFFHRRCSETLVMEREIWQLHSLMAQECRQPALKQFFERWNAPKRQQISALEQIVDELGGIIGLLEHPVTQAARRQHRAFAEQLPPQALVELHDTVEADQLAGLALSTYRSLILLARQLHETGFGRLLEQNLHIEEEMRDALAHLQPDLVTTLGEQLKHAA